LTDKEERKVKLINLPGGNVVVQEKQYEFGPEKIVGMIINKFEELQ